MAQHSDQDDPIGAVSAESLGISLHTGVRRRLKSDSFKKFLEPPAPAITKRTGRGRTAKLTKRERCRIRNGGVPELEDDSTGTASTDPTNLSPERGASDSAQVADDISNSRNVSAVGHLLDCCAGFTAGYVCAVTTVAILHYVS